MDLGVHLPLMSFGAEPLSFVRLRKAVDTARECGFAAVSANDHFIFQTAWLDGPTALASVIERSGQLPLATTLSLAVLRGPVPLAKALAAIDILSEGRLVAAVGPGSSKRDYDSLGVCFEERWKRFDEALALLRALLKGEPFPEDARYYRVPSDIALAPAPRRPRARAYRHPAGTRAVAVASLTSGRGGARALTAARLDIAESCAVEAAPTVGARRMGDGLRFTPATYRGLKTNAFVRRQ